MIIEMALLVIAFLLIGIGIELFLLVRLIDAIVNPGKYFKSAKSEGIELLNGDKDDNRNA